MFLHYTLFFKKYSLLLFFTFKLNTMENIISQLYKAIDNINNEKLNTNTRGKDHGSADQTRGILLESILSDCMCDIDKVIERLKIINRELY